MDEQTTKETDKLNNNRVIWDCDSSLYDSFELNSLQKKLDEAIVSSRSLSMPHLSENRSPPPTNKKPTSKIARSIQRLIKAIFRPKNGVSSKTGGGFYVFYDRSGALTTIPEAPEFDGLSPELKTLVRRTGSDRFSDKALGISCS